MNLDFSIFAIVLCFGIFAVFVNRFFLRPMESVLAERRASTDELFEAARALHEKSSGQLAQYENALREARFKSYAFLENERMHAQEARAQRLLSERQRTNQLLSEARQKLLREAEESKAKLTSEAERLAEIIVRQVLRSS